MTSAWRTCSRSAAGQDFILRPIFTRRRRASRSLTFLAVVLLTVPLAASTVSGTADIVGERSHSGDSGVVVWLEPKDAEPPDVHPGTFRMLQHHKQFQPHVLAIPVGSAVDFPNLDPIFHNAFSNVDGKRFDVSLYPPGTSRRVVFDRPGIVHVFCNIHQAMSAVIVVQDTPWLAISNRRGEFSIPNVPPGRYVLHVYYERATKEALEKLVRTIDVGPGPTTVAPIQVSETGYIELPHKNKYGSDYPPGEGPYSGGQ